MQLIAHRGLKNEYIKENTVDAFLNAINNNYNGIELDVRYTKDKEIVVIHDSFINRTSNGKGKVKNYTYKELLKYNFGSKEKNAKLPKLKDVIKNVNNSIIFIELKEKIDYLTLESILDRNHSNQYYICSFNKKYIDEIGETKYKKGLINYVFNSGIDIKEYDFLLILEDLFNENILNYLNKINVEPVIYNTMGKISIKNKEIINNLKYII